MGLLRLAVVLVVALLAAMALKAAPVEAATMPETAQPLAARESTPLCSPECEVIMAPTEAASGREYEGGGPGGGFTPQELREAYGLPEHGGAGVTVAVIDGRGDPEAEADMAFYREHFELPECSEASGCFRQLDETGEPRDPTVAGSWVGEISLDLDMVTAACPECHIMLFEGVGVEGLLESIETAIEMGADVVTNSWNMGFEEGNPADTAGCEIESCVSPSEEAAIDPRLDHPGIPILFSGGDYGYAVRYPAVSPYVISVGGTRLRHEPDSERGWDEEAWSNTAYGQDRKGRGTGSGCSVAEPKPEWETDTACPTRIENDVAADADPRSPVSAYDSAEGGWKLPGGTSASAPFVAGVEALSSATAREEGAAALWRVGGEGKLFDVTTGSDGTCTPPTEDAYWCAAGVGYDGPTGWGTPNGVLFTSGPPIVATAAADAVGTAGATLHGEVDDTGIAGGTECSFELTVASDPSFTSPLRTVDCDPALIEGDSTTPVSAALTGLAPHTRYLFRVAGTNAEGGPVFGATSSFETAAEPPEELSRPPGPIARTTAELRAEVDNRGAPAGTACAFEVTDRDDVEFERPFETLPCDPGLIEGEGPVPVSLELTGLSVNTTYLYRLTVSSSGGEADWIEDDVTTLPEPPSVSTGGAANVTRTAALLKGRIDDEGDSSGSSCAFQVTAVSNVEFDAPSVTVPCEPETVEGEEEVAVTAGLSDLNPGTEYRYRIEATNSGGTSTGEGRVFETEAAPPQIEPENETGPVHPIEVQGPPDEKELQEAKEREEEAKRSSATTASPTPSPGSGAPSNRFSLGHVTRHGKDLTITISVPGPGTIAVTARASIHRTTAKAIGSGSLTLRVPLAATTTRRAAQNPKMRLKLVVTYTPTGGTAAAKSLSVPVGRQVR